MKIYTPKCTQNNLQAIIDEPCLFTKYIQLNITEARYHYTFQDVSLIVYGIIALVYIIAISLACFGVKSK